MALEMGVKVYNTLIEFRFLSIFSISSNKKMIGLAAEAEGVVIRNSNFSSIHPHWNTYVATRQAIYGSRANQIFAEDGGSLIES